MVTINDFDDFMGSNEVTACAKSLRATAKTLTTGP